MHYNKFTKTVWESLYSTGVQHLQNKFVSFRRSGSYLIQMLILPHLLQIVIQYKLRNMLFEPAAYDIHIIIISEANSNKTRYILK